MDFRLIRQARLSPYLRLPFVTFLATLLPLTRRDLDDERLVFLCLARFPPRFDGVWLRARRRRFLPLTALVLAAVELLLERRRRFFAALELAWRRLLFLRRVLSEAVVKLTRLRRLFLGWVLLEAEDELACRRLFLPSVLSEVVVKLGWRRPFFLLRVPSEVVVELAWRRLPFLPWVLFEAVVELGGRRLLRLWTPWPLSEEFLELRRLLPRLARWLLLPRERLRDPRPRFDVLAAAGWLSLEEEAFGFVFLVALATVCKSHIPMGEGW